jgi:6-phosphogluconolactonase
MLVAKGVANPSYSYAFTCKKYFYAVNELKTFNGKNMEQSVRLHLIQALYYYFINWQETGGTDPCHVIVNDQNTHVFVSNFMSGSVCVFPIQPDGTLGSRSDFIQTLWLKR